MIRRSSALRAWRGGLVAGLLLAGSPAFAADIDPFAVAGPWLTRGGDSIVRFDACGTGWCGRIAKVLHRDPKSALTDIKNPDPALRSHPIEGLQILHLTTRDPTTWRGTVYDPRSGRTWTVYVHRTAARHLEVKGCLAFLCQAQDWVAAEG